LWRSKVPKSKLIQKPVLKLRRILVGEELRVDKDYIQKPVYVILHHIYVYLRKDYEGTDECYIDRRMPNAERRARLFWQKDFIHA
jgi:hypothetical protein